MHFATTRLFALATVTLSCGTAQADTIDCKESLLQVFPGATCTRTDVTTKTGSKSGAFAKLSSMDYQAQGTHDGITYSVIYHKGESSRQSVKPATEASRASTIKSFDAFTGEGKSWSNAEHAGAALYRTFTHAKQRCFGFHEYGAPKGGGYDSVTKGYFCRTASKAFDATSVSALLAEIKTR